MKVLVELKVEFLYLIIVKEIGVGVFMEVVVRFESIGIDVIDVGGFGGMSWSGVEYYCVKDEIGKDLVFCFWDWGIKIVISVVEVRYVIEFLIIVIGGMRDGIVMVKVLVMGVIFVGVVLLFFKLVVKGDVEGVIKIFRCYIEEIRNVMFFVGVRNVEELRKVLFVIMGFIREWLE